MVVSIGANGDFSAGHVAGVGAITLDGAAATTGQVTLTGITAGGNVTVSMGAGTGALTMASSLTLARLRSMHRTLVEQSMQPQLLPLVQL